MHIFTIDVGGSSIKYALFDEDRNKLLHGKVKTPMDTLEHFYEAIYSIIPNDIDGIAISMPGVIDSKNGVARTGGALLYIDQEPIVERLTGIYHVPVWIGNDAKCAALAEVGFGSCKDVNDAFVIILGTGIGGCMIIDHQVHYGVNYSAGEVSSVLVNNTYPISKDSFWCMVNGIQGLLTMVQRHLDTDQRFSGEQIFEMANHGDERVLRALDEFCFNVAVQCLNIQAVMDPELFVIGGGISVQPLLIQKIQEQLDRLHDISVIPLPKIQVVPCYFRNDANLIGAYYQLLKEMEK